MSPILTIASNTYREIIRDRILYSLVVLSLILVGVALALGELTYAERIRISANFGLAGIQLSAVILSIFVGSTLVSKEIDKKTIMTLLARPVQRWQFLIGKSLGLIGVILTILSGLAVVLVCIFLSMGMYISPNLFMALHGIMLEAMVLLGFALFFSTFAAPMSVVSFCVGIFLIGHWLESLNFFIAKSESGLFQALGKLIVYVFPNLEVFNWRASIAYDDSVPVTEVLSATGYMGLWMAFLILSAAAVFRRKDFA